MRLLRTVEAVTHLSATAASDFAAAQPGWNADPQGTLQRAQSDPRFHQVYLRYFGGVR